MPFWNLLRIKKLAFDWSSILLKNNHNHENTTLVYSHYRLHIIYSYTCCVLLTMTGVTFHFISLSRKFHTDFIRKLFRSASVIHFIRLCRWNFCLPSYQREYLIVRSRRNVHNSAFKFSCARSAMKTRIPTNGDDCLNKCVCCCWYFFRMLHFQFEYIVQMAPLCQHNISSKR